MAFDWFSAAPMPIRFGIQPIDQVVGDASPYTGAREVMLRYHQWHVIFEWNALPIRDYLALVGHLCNSRGGVNLFQVPILAGRAARGTKAGIVRVAEDTPAGATSAEITGGTGTINEGDWFYVLQAANTPRAHVLTSTEVGGVIEFWPGFRSAVAALTVVHHKGNGEIYDTMELATPTPSFGTIDVSPSPNYALPGFSVEFVSALRANL